MKSSDYASSIAPYHLPSSSISRLVKFSSGTGLLISSAQLDRLFLPTAKNIIAGNKEILLRKVTISQIPIHRELVGRLDCLRRRKIDGIRGTHPNLWMCLRNPAELQIIDLIATVGVRSRPLNVEAIQSDSRLPGAHSRGESRTRTQILHAEVESSIVHLLDLDSSERLLSESQKD